MRLALIAAALLLVTACTPTANWREVPIGSTGLRATFPCKPDTADRRAEIAPGREIVLHATGCETGGAAFAIVYGDAGQPSELSSTLAQWKKASLATSKSAVDTEKPGQPAGALPLPESAMLLSHGQRPDGSALQTQSAFFARGTQVYQAVVFSNRLKPEMTEPFFTGLRFE